MFGQEVDERLIGDQLAEHVCRHLRIDGHLTHGGDATPGLDPLEDDGTVQVRVTDGEHRRLGGTGGNEQHCQEGGGERS